MARFGDHPVFQCDARNRSIADYEVLRAGLISGAQQKATLLRHVMAQEDWDFLMGVFSESHCVGHQFWHFTDPSHPRYDGSAPAALQSAILDVYQAIDTGLGDILDDIGPDIPALVLLSHGMGPFYAGSNLLEEVLERLGVGAPLDASGFPARDSYAARGIHGVFWGLRRFVPTDMRRALKAWLPGPLAALWNLAHPVPNLWKPGMRAWAVPSHNMTGAIRINLQGREPFGAVAPGAEYETLCDELTERLLELENRLHNLPDLFVEWRHDAPISALSSPAIGKVTGRLAADRTGDHWEQGLLIGRSPHFHRAEIGKVRTQDLGPTLLDLVGVPIPADYEGRSLATQMVTPSQPVA